MLIQLKTELTETILKSQGRPNNLLRGNLKSCIEWPIAKNWTLQLLFAYCLFFSSVPECVNLEQTCKKSQSLLWSTHYLKRKQIKLAKRRKLRYITMQTSK